MAFSKKRNKWGIEDILSWKLPLEFLGFLFAPGNSRKIKASPQKLHKIMLHSSEFLRPKTKISGNYIWIFSLLITPENSMLLLNSTLNSPKCLFFFWNSSMAGVKVVYLLGNFCWHWICSSQVLNFQMLFYQQKLSF